MLKRELKTLLPFPIELWDWQFIKSLPKYLSSFSKPDLILADELFIQLVKNDLFIISDRQSQGHLLFCARIHACYLVLVKEHMQSEEAIASLCFAIQQPGKRTLKWIMRLSLWLSRNKRKMIEDAINKKKETMYGEQFNFEEETSANTFVSVVNKCAYVDYFQRHKLLQIMPSICEWDKVWIDPIEQHNNGEIEFSRPTTLALGDKSCRFEFRFKP